MNALLKYSLSFLISTMLLVSSGSYAQDLAGHNWFFGNSSLGIRFNRVDNSPSLFTTQATPFGTGGSAVATDPTNGNILFYTDGANVYDVTHTVMPNGGGLDANTSGNQAVAIAPVPGQPNQYYIFTNTASFPGSGTISFTIVDMNLFGNAVFPAPALGDVTNPKNTVLLNNRSEGMIVIPHDNGSDFWLISHENNTDNYTSTLITTSGTFTHTTFNGLTGISLSAANLSYHAGSGRLAVSPQTSNRNVVILSIDNTNGILTFDRFILNSAVTSTTNQAIFDTEWSASGDYLYISVHGEPGIQADVLQADLNNPTSTLSSVRPQPNTIFRSYGLQMAPDSTIYHLFQETPGGVFLLAGISNTDTVFSEVDYEPDVFGGGLDFNGTQFPAFSPQTDPNLQVTFTYLGTCSNAATSFFPTVTPAADSLVWDFGDGQGSSDWSPVHTYENGGSFPVTVFAFLNGETATYTEPVNITQFDLQITLVADTAACRDEFPPPRGNSNPEQFSVKASIQGGTPVSIVWSNGDTGETLTPDSAGYYYVVVTDISGCSSYAGVNVREYGLEEQRANIWYFGQNAGIDFNPLPDDPPVAISNPSMDTPEGCAVICDRNGQVLFYTDGDKVWDREDTEIATEIGGDPGASQSALIIPVPGDETLYYIFTTNDVEDNTSGYRLSYSLFDLKLNNGLGAVVEKNVTLFTRSTEHITGNANWLIAHEFGNNSFRAYRITQQGVGNPVITSIGSDHGLIPIEAAQGYMKLGAGNRLAVALSNPGVSNKVEIFDFIDSSGVVTNFRSVDLNSTTGQVYGIEFSPAGNKLFATLTGSPSPSDIYEFAFDSLGNPYFQQSVSQPLELGALQIAPNGLIHAAANNSTSVFTFPANEDTTQLTALSAMQIFPLVGGTQSRLGLPNFIQNISNFLTEPSITVAGLCLGDSTQFTGSGTDPVIDEYQWFFGDGFGSTGQTASHLYAAAGTYNVSLRITNRCGLDTTLTQTITIVEPPADPTFLPPNQQPVLCDGTLTLEATPATNPDLPDLSFLWSTGETTRTIVVDRPMYVSVTITNAAGCTSDAEIFVSDNRPIVDLGPDLTLCQNAPFGPLDAQNPGATYSWTVNGGSPSSDQTRSVDTSVPGVYTYIVEVTDTITTCVVSDTVTITINESPSFSVVTANTTGCGVNDGQITVTINGPATALFSYTITGPGTTLTGIDQPVGALPAFTGLAAGTYAITIADQVTGCATITTAGISDNSFTVTGTPQGNCEPIPIDIILGSVLGSFTYAVTDVSTGLLVTSGNGSGSTFTTNPVPGGEYVVEVTDGTCTNVSAAIQVTPDPPTAAAFNLSDICDGVVSIESTTATALSTFSWTSTPAGAFNGPTNQGTVTVNPGTWLISATVSNGIDCPETYTTSVTVDDITLDFIQSDPCEDQVTLTTTGASGNFTYRWYRNGVLVPGGSQITIGTTDNTVSYRVEAVSTITGCVFPSPVRTVNIIGDLQVSLAVTAACEGSPFTLTATSSLPGVSYTWEYLDTPIAGASGPTYQDTRAGAYTVTVSVSGCSAETKQTVVLAPTTPGDLNNTYFICNDAGNPDPESQQVELDAGDGFTSYDWFRDGVALNVTTQTYTATEPGVYSVNLINVFGCPSTDQTEVVLECNPRIVAPNAFRPGSTVSSPGNPEFSNSDFYILSYFIEDEDFQVFIFNRWGELIYQSADRNFRWNGGYKNNPDQPLPPGNYTYMVSYRSVFRPDLGVQEARGGIVLLR